MPNPSQSRPRVECDEHTGFSPRYTNLIKCIIVAVIVVGTSAPVRAIGYDDFPPNLRAVLDERIAALDANGGTCIAGRVTFSDASAISGGSDVQVNFRPSADIPVFVYPDGWFIMNRTSSRFYAGTDKKLVLRAFEYDPIDAFITVHENEITYVEFEMLKTHPELLSSVIGTVTDENDEPFPSATVALYYPMASLGTNNQPFRTVQANGAGQFMFSGLSSTEYRLFANSIGYAVHGETFTLPPGSVGVENRRLYPDRQITIRYVYQADGSRDFTKGAIYSGVVNWLNGSGGMDFAKGQIITYNPNNLRDLELSQTQDVLEFRNFYVNGNNGFYDAGAVDFESLAMAATTGYSTARRPAIVGHTYVVSTYDEAHYAKFIVESDEHSFRTVIAGDPPALVFAGYGLTIDFTYSSAHTQVFVERQFRSDLNIQIPFLPSVWVLSGMAGAVFESDLHFTYLDADLVSRRVPEHGLTVLLSTNQGTTWFDLMAEHDPQTNSMSVPGLQSLGWFAIANTADLIVGDLDQDGDLDLADYRGVMNCFTGNTGTVNDTACIPAMVSDNASIGLDALAVLSSCMAGPNSDPGPHCGY